ncbi:hypothetical protein FHS29_005017 [Saccharothrix tamanrassetensis]|uniref:Uncharacterized protein n=1 Tax=Saccharothrix tamanrassetensis TaxID=1051531 RepID=A0A841CM83_9PSEU|nr:hypothetical protein [Saccharothrix tamanrassetensis]MBB5958409.1 hypothetical protein [Saccharothrix tamanrassetensis]
MTTPPTHLIDPATPLVALEGGPKHRRWFFYTDWLTARRASRLHRYPLNHPCGSERCYLPTDRHTDNPDELITQRHGQARVWTWVTPEQWQRWGREYLTPEERISDATERTTR